MWNDLIGKLQHLPPYAWNLVLTAVAVVCGLIFKVLATLVLRLYSKANLNFSIVRSIIRRVNKPLSWFLPLFVLNLLLPLMDLTTKQETIVSKLLTISLIISFSTVLVAIVKIAEDVFYHIYDLNKADNLRERKIRTQLQFVRKMVISLIVVLALGAILLSFSSLRRIGTGLLTGVGISGIIVGLAAQRSLGNLLAGLQIAFTQPMRLDDVLIVEGEWGRVEEITLTYVVLHIWDQRRLILPINYFIEKPFQNWTRTSAEIFGTIFLHLDYKAPFDEIRAEFKRVLDANELWDKKAGTMQITGSTDQTVEVRLLVSAVNAGTVFDLRCFIREHMIGFIQKNHPEALPRTRAIIDLLPDKFLLHGEEHNSTTPA